MTIFLHYYFRNILTAKRGEGIHFDDECRQDKYAVDVLIELVVVLFDDYNIF